MNTIYRITNWWSPEKVKVKVRDMTKKEIEYFENMIKKQQGNNTNGPK